MIAGLEGPLVRRGADYVVVNAGGVHYKVTVSPQTLSTLGTEGQKVQLCTYLQVREDILQLYGFRSMEEQELFEQVLNVSGIGPKGALGLVGSMPPDALRQAISTGNVDLIKRAPGIGVKTAQRLVLELKGKLVAGVVPVGPPGSPEADLAEALASLGYSAAEIEGVTGYLKGTEDLPVEERLRRALRFFAQGKQ